jgi:beta-lactamase class A
MYSAQTRRGFSCAFGAALVGVATSRPVLARAQSPVQDAFDGKVTEIEKRLGARLGVAVLDTKTARRWAHRPDERFPMCSTFKVLASGRLLELVDGGKEDLGRRVRIEASDVVSYSPVTESRIGGEGMTLAELCAAALTRSDNTAGNLILKSIGGPSSVTAFARSLGDAVTRLDRWETALNEATPGDPRDTTTPAAMTADIHALILGDSLSDLSRQQLTTWLVSNTTGSAKIRAGLPTGWRVGDKTGGGEHGTMNDVAVIWPPRREPVIVSIFMTETRASFDDRNAAIAEIACELTGALAS